MASDAIQLSPTADSSQIAGIGVAGVSPEDPLPARMVNEFVYCPRLFYYEHVEGVFLENADTLRGTALHRRVDAGSSSMPSASAKKKARAKKKAARKAPPGEEEPEKPETIHSRSVSLGSDTLGVVAKLDLVETRVHAEDLFSEMQVCPVDYKAGSPQEDEEGQPTLWDADKIQLGLQMLLLRENGYHCDEGIIYYRGTKQRVRLSLTKSLEEWIGETVAAARACAQGPIPPPLEGSRKCVRCSLAPICLPDETRSLRSPDGGSDRNDGVEEILQNVVRSVSAPSPLRGEGIEGREEDAEHRQRPGLPTGNRPAIRRLIATRDETRALYLNTQGLRVGRSSDVIQVKERDRVIQEVRMSDLSHVALFGNIQISTQALQRLCEKEIPIAYFSMGGWFYGITHGHGLKNVFSRMRQFSASADPSTSLLLAQRFIHGKIRNQRTLLRRNHVEPPENVLKRLKRAADVDVFQTSGLTALLGVEGAAASLYFQHVSGMIKLMEPGGETEEEAGEDSLGWSEHPFQFEHRNRRPPRDPVNALLSLAYSVLAKDCTVAAMAVGLDPYVGFFHQPRFGRPSLALDVMEEFRPLIADSAVITAINNRLLTRKDFVRAGDAVNLTPRGRRTFFEAYERRINQLVTHPVFDYQVSYRRAIELQLRMLSRYLTGEIPDYIPFTTR